MKKLTEEEVNYLFNFTKKHFVDFYDVQIELVDHLANAIEKEWEVNPKLSFEDALQIEFKKFGVFGFTGLIEQKQNELHKYYNKMLWKEVMKFISIPKIMITVLLYFMIFLMLKKSGIYAESTACGLLLLSFFYYLIDCFSFMRKLKKQQKYEGKNWLMQSVATQVLSIPIIGCLGFGFSLFSNFFRSNNNELSVFGLNIFTIIILFQIITFYVFTKILKPKIVQTIYETKHKFQGI